MSIPPPLPPGQSRSDRMADAFAHRGAPPSAPPRKPGMSGCAIVAIIGAVVLVFGVFIAGILAAIAIPAYNDYLLRSKVTAAETYAGGLQGAIDLHRQDAGECPDNAAIGLSDPDVLELGRDSADLPEHVSLTIGESGAGRCAIELTFANVDPQLDGKTALFESGDGGWDCSGGTLPAKYRSPRCRAGDASYDTSDNTVSP